MKKLMFLLVLFCFQFSFAQWQPCNVGLYNNINCITSDGTNLYCGSYLKMFISSDKGQNWLSANKNLPDDSNNYGIFSLLISNNVIYAGTWGAGLYISTDNGKNWVSNNGVLSKVIMSIIKDSNYIFAGTFNNGIFRTSDNGNLWWYSDLKNYITNTLYKSRNNLFAGTNNGIFLSTDEGKTWTTKNNGISNLGIHSFVYHNDRLYVGTVVGMFSSTNNGDEWLPVNFNSRDSNVLSLASIDNKIIAMIDSSGIFISDDNGNTWLPKNNNLPVDKLCSLYVLDKDIFIGTLGQGIFKSTDAGETWLAVNNGLTNANKISVISSKDKYLYSVSNANGLYISTNNGNNWEINSSFSGPIYSFTQYKEFIYVDYFVNQDDGSTYGGIFYSDDNGINWKSCNNSIFRKNKVNVLAVADSNIYAGIDTCLYYSSDKGSKWKNINGSLPHTSIQCLALYNEGLYAGFDGLGLYFTSDNGQTWLPKNNGLTYTFIRSLIIDNNTLYAGTYGGGLYISKDAGDSWIQKNNGLTDSNVVTIAIKNNNIFAGTGSGVFVSSNNGDSWIQKNNGLYNINIHSLNITNDSIFAATDVGVYRAKADDLIITGVNDNTEDDIDYLYAFPPYPTPGYNQICFHLYWDLCDDIDNDEINVYNILGEKIAGRDKFSLLKNSMYDGYITWDCSEVPSGIYMIHISKGNYSITVKAVVSR